MSDEMIAGTTRIKGFNGQEIEAYLARPTSDEPTGGVVVIHHAPGYDWSSKEIARKFAWHGYAAMCPNLHYHQAPDTAPDDAAAAVRSQGGVPDDQLLGDVNGAIEALRALDNSNGKVASIGYCSGGRQSFLSACNLSLDAAIVCYGAFIARPPGPEMPYKMSPILDQASKISCPILGLFGKEDKYPGPDEVAEIDSELTRLGKEHEFHSFENAGHAFFAVDKPAYRPEAANEGYEYIWNFLSKTIGGK